jgi:hypothetical protein
MATISEVRPAEPLNEVQVTADLEVEVPASTAQQDALEHYGWPPPTKAADRVITLPG